VATIDECLGTLEQAAGRWSAQVGRELYGAFGGAFGGVLAAIAVHVARTLAPGRAPAGIDCHFLTGLRAGDAAVRAAVVREGRSLSIIDVSIADSGGTPATEARVTLVDPSALSPVDAPPDLAPVTGEGRPWAAPAGIDIPIITTLQPRTIPCDDGSTAVALRVPWDDAEGSCAAEAACLAGDLAVGPPVAEACGDTWTPHPNPDFALRFATMRTTSDEVVGIGRLAGVDAGLAAVTIDVRSAAGQRLAVGIASSLLLGPREGAS
jgi:acyl-coenzyme A thioesterase PaaI-like protein